ncbi:NAD(P)-binding protein [Peniophora sp. CONT]|nr:NAD(P)-binding protein [Peniophora sp. CONT]
MASPTHTAIIFGATGATGRHVLRELLESPTYSKVLEAGRRVTPVDKLPPSAKDKLEQQTIDFEKLEENSKLQGYDHVYITLGTTKKNAGSAEAFERIDREYVLNAAKAAKTPGSTTQRLLYCSSAGSSPTSYFLYPRSKGLTERGLADLGYAETFIFRPGALVRHEPRLVERVLVPILSVPAMFYDGLMIQVEQVARAMLTAGSRGASSISTFTGVAKENLGGPEFTAVNNAGCLALAKEKDV